MKKFLFLSLFLFPILLVGQNRRAAISTNLIIRFQPNVNAVEFFQKYNTNRRHKIKVKVLRKVSTIFNIYVIQSNDNQLLIEQLNRNKAVLKIGYDQKVQYRNTEPNDADFGEQWNMKNIQADLVWDETTGGQTADGKRIIIGVLEKGIDPTHEDLVENIWTNQAEIPNNGIDDDDNGYVDDFFGLNLLDLTDEHTPFDTDSFRIAHGTQVAGVIGAKGDNTIGVTGINWDIDLLLFSKVDFVSDVLKAQEYAYNLRKLFNKTDGEAGAFIVALNHSFGWDGRPEDNFMGEELCEMMALIGQEGILSVVATDNREIDVDEVGDLLPNCTSDFVIAVTSSNERNEKVRASGFGSESIDLAAPGERIYTLDLDNGYGIASGTSFACPLVAGTIGLLYSLPCTQLRRDAVANPAATAKFIKEAILKGSQPIEGFNGRSLTGGRLDAFGAMQNVQLYCGQPQSNNFEILELYPNPASNTITVAFETTNFEPHQFQIINALGQMVLQKIIQPSRFEENVLTQTIQHFPSGVYFLTLLTGKRAVTKRFIIGN